MVLGAVTIGLYMFGVVGGIIAIPIAGTVRILIEEFLEHRREVDAGPVPKAKLAAATVTTTKKSYEVYSQIGPEAVSRTATPLFDSSSRISSERA